MMDEIFDSKYDYVRRVANEIKPEFELDDDGECVQILSETAFTFLRRMDKIKPPFTYRQFIDNEDIIATLEGYEIDPESFWLAILFVYDITQEKCVNVLTLGDSLKVQTDNLKELLTGADDFTITVAGKKKLKVNDAELIKRIRDCLDYISNPDNNLDGRHFKLGATSDDLYSPSIQMWYAANRFLALVQSLGLPNKRAKDSAVVFNRYDAVVGGGNKLVSYNKLLLVSRLMYLMRYTRNDMFLYSDNSLKGILKQYKNFELNTFSKAYFA
jgi:hypothetical protein